MSIFKYDNYNRPFAGFGAFAAEYGPPPPSQPPFQPSASQDGLSEWIRRNWPVVLEILAYIFLGGAAIGRARQKVDAHVPKGEIKQDDFEWMVQRAMKLDPTLSRAEVEKRLCGAFGDRIPACYERKKSPEESTNWLTYAALGLVGFMLLK